MRNEGCEPIVLLSAEKDLAVSGADVVRLFYPDRKIVHEPCPDLPPVLRVSAGHHGNMLTARAELVEQSRHFKEEVSAETVPAAGDTRNQQKRLVKLALYRLLCRYTNLVPGPWGILTGIRPTKIVHRLMDSAWNRPDIIKWLVRSYNMAVEKARLLTDIAERERLFLPDAAGAARAVSAYIGIPFCPTKCAYCSFPSYPVGQAGHLLESFLQALLREIAGIGGLVREQGLDVQSIYLGGGTPTVLREDELACLLEHVRKWLVSAATVEITLEAGRPDTLTRAKLKTALDYGVTRLSINPQSMNPGTLKAIGREHTPEQVWEAFATARALGFDNINMDIIIGLPGEEAADVRNTLDLISQMNPDNLTMHTLAVKRASRIKENREAYLLPGGKEVQEMLEITAQAAAAMGMRPYYLYRQKRMVGPLENIGYARPGHECIYNIQIIGERQTVIGFGGGAGSKFVEPGTWLLTSHYNPKDPETYIARVNELITGKTRILERMIYNIGQ